MEDKPVQWNFYSSGTQYDSPGWTVTREGKMVGSMTLVRSRFRAYLKRNEHSKGDYLGEFDTMPQAIGAIKEMWNMT